MPETINNEAVLRNKLAEVHQGLSDLILQILGRVRQVADKNVVNQLDTEWTNLRKQIQQQLTVGLRFEANMASAGRFFSSSEAILDFAEKSTPLDVANERIRFNRIKLAWDESIDEFYESEDKSVEQDSPATPKLQALDARLDALEVKLIDTNEQLRLFRTILDVLKTKFEEKISHHQARYEEFNDAYDAVKPTIDARVAALDELIRHQGQKVLAGRYEVDADSEQTAADRFRWAAIGVMAAIVLLIGFSYYELSNFTLNPVQATIRIVFSLILSVPAAYLARESAKHRQRQYVLRQTALEIGAIDSYIQTLPIDSQNKIKAETAIKLFTPQKLDAFDKDSYPINAQELFAKLIEVVGELKKEVGDKKDSKKDED